MTLPVVRQPFSMAPISDDPPLLDDAAGCRSAGSRTQLGLLRRLLRYDLIDEAPVLRGDVDPVRVTAVLHRWTSACAFCGARRLRDRIERWRQGLRSAEPDARPVDFEQVLAATCRSIEAVDA